MGAAHGQPLLEATSLTKVFPGTVAVDEVDLTVAGGRVMAVVGANGSGKTTLLSMLCGLHAPTSGRIVVDGEEVAFGTPHDALKRGIAYVPQEPQLAPTLPAWENLLLAELGSLRRLRPGAKERAKARELAAEVLDGRSPDTPVGRLRKADRAMLSMFAALRHQPRILALDEPTAVLGARGAEVVEQAVADVVKSGGAVLLVSHRLRDIVQLASHVVVLVDGRKVHDAEIETSTVASLVDSLASGRDDQVELSTDERATDERATDERNAGGLAALPADETRDDHDGDAPTVVLEDVRTSDGLHIAHLRVSCGEIVGVAGLAGGGRSRLCRVVAGCAPRTGTITYVGGDHRANPVAMRRRGVAYIPEDRKREGVFGPLSIEKNLEISDVAASPLMRRWSRNPDRRKWAAVADRFGIKRSSPKDPITALSGGNQQRCVLARTLARQPRLLVADEPTQGVDQSGRRAIHAMIKQFAGDGGSAIVVSSEFDELQQICDRIIVLLDGELVADLPADTEYRDLVSYATLGEIAPKVDANA